MPLIFSEYIADFFVTPKFILFYLIAFMLIGVGVLLKRECKLKINKLFGFLFFANAIIYVLVQPLFLGGSYRVVTYDLICLSIVLFFSMLAKANDKYFISKLGLFNMGSLSIVVITVLINLGMKNASSLDLFFGNKNHLAEFLGASIVLQIVLFFENRSINRIYKIFFWIIIVGALYICFQTLCRSVLLSGVICLLWFFCLLVVKNLRQNGKLKFKAINIALAIFIVFSGAIYSYKTYFSETSEIAYIKRATTNLRLIRWENTWEMFKKHPMGVGPSNYEFAYLDYKDKKANDFEITESVLVKSPHNGYLELFSEYGIIIGISFLFLVVFLFFEFVFLESILYFYLLLFFCINAIFSFPMELSFSSYMIALFVGAGLVDIRSKFKDMEIQFVWFLRVLLLPFGISTVIVILSLVSSNMIEDKFQSKLLCSFTPSIWRNCVDAGVQDISEGRFQEASDVLEQYLKLYPNNFIAQRYYAFSLSKLGRIEEACRVLESYDQLFLGKSSIGGIKTKQCQSKNGDDKN